MNDGPLNVHRSGEDAPEPLASGTMLGHYRIIEALGAGAAARVYRAEDTRLRRDVALKFLLTDAREDEDARKQLLQEARAASRLSHPHIAAVHAVEEIGAHLFLVMEYAGDRTLATELTGEPFSLHRLQALAVQLASGLAAAHAAKVVHRDLKPGNVLLSADGDAKIADFGIATATAQAPSDDPKASGTPAYMSPEQALGQPTDARSDVFSLGVILYELATGRRPFKGRYEAALAFSIINDEPPAPSTLRSDLPAALEQVILKAMAKDPDRRYADASELAADLKQMTGPTRKSPVPGRTWAAWSAVALILVIAWWWSGQNGESPPPQGPGRVILAVLPFENLGPPADEYFADGVTDAIATRLAAIDQLGVIPPTSTRSYKGTDRRLSVIGQELGAAYILAGTIHWEKDRIPGRVKVSPKLVRVADETFVWTDESVYVLDSIFGLQSKIAQQAAEALNVALLEGEAQAFEQPLTDNLEAYDAYLRGNAYFQRGWDEESIRLALQMYEQATDLDSHFTLAWVMRARSEASLYWEYYDRSDARREAARQAAERALALEPDRAESHLAMGYYFYHCRYDYDRALSEFAQALKDQPHNVELLSAIAAIQRRLGNLNLAVGNFVEAYRLDPRQRMRTFDVALTFGMMQQWDRAEAYLDSTRRLAPEWELPYIFGAWLHILGAGDVDAARRTLENGAAVSNLREWEYYWWLTRIVYDDFGAALGRSPQEGDRAGYYVHQGRLNHLAGKGDARKAYYDSARVILEARTVGQPDAARYWSWLGQAYAGLGQAEAAMEAGRRAVELLPFSRDAFDALFLLVNLAETQVMIGDHQGAVQQLAFLLSQAGFVSVPYLKLDPLWDPLRERADFQELLGEAPGGAIP